MKRKFLSLALVLALCMGLVPAALAYETPDFSDVPSNHWAYEAIMKMADAGVIKGTGNGQFSPDMKLSVEMFIVLVGRVVFPDVTAEGSDWSGPYVAEAKAKGLLDGTNVTDGNLTGEISRYDMAVILTKCAELLKIKTTKADQNKVTDYGDLPIKYADAVLTVYGSGLIQGDQSGRFNGSNSMTRQEAATVLSRLVAIPEEQAKAEAAQKEQAAKEAQEWYESSRTGEYVTVNFYGRVSEEIANAPVGLYFKDGRLLGQTVSGEKGKWSMDITMDKADYSFTEDWYYTAVIGQVTATIYGKEYTFETKLEYVTPSSIWENTVNTRHGFFTDLSPIE